MVQAYQHALRLGYQRIGFVVDRDADERLRHHWLGAYLAMQHKHARRNQALPPLMEHPLHEKTLKPWIVRHRPDLILCATNDLWPWVENCGYRVPHDIGIISVAAPQMGAPLSGIVENFESTGARAVDDLIFSIEHNVRGIPENPNVHLSSGLWNPGETVRATA
jgi:DNA-binding LacI/PurR family transcriptional regulator